MHIEFARIENVQKGSTRMAFYETEKTGSVPPSDLAKSLMQYRRAHNLSREELAKKLSPLSFDQIKNV